MGWNDWRNLLANRYFDSSYSVHKLEERGKCAILGLPVNHTLSKTKAYLLFGLLCRQTRQRVECESGEDQQHMTDFTQQRKGKSGDIIHLMRQMIVVTRISAAYLMSNTANFVDYLAYLIII